MKGEPARFAEEIRQLHHHLVGTARPDPIEPNIVLRLIGDGKVRPRGWRRAKPL